MNLISADEELSNNDNNNHYQRQNDYRSSPSQYQGRTFFNRNRSGILEQVILIRSDCVSRIVGNLEI